METLVQIDAWDPVAAEAVTLYACSHDEPAVCHALDGTWWPVLTKLPALRYDLFDGAFGAEISTPGSSISLQTEPFPNFGRYSFADARFRLWTGDLGGPSPVWTLRFDGRVTAQPESADGSATAAFAVDDRWLDTPLLSTYAGTTGIEGPAGMKGQPKPLALGAPRYVPGKLIDSVNSVFQVSGYGAVNDVEAALERLVRFGASAGNYATYAALVAATIAPGTWATCKEQGLVRFGAPTTGQISFLVKGDEAGPNGWARKPGQLIRRIALLSGGAGKIDDASLDALDAARPYNISIYIDAQTTAREVIQQIAASVNAVAGVSWLGKLFVTPIGIGTPSMTLAADGSALPPVMSVRQIEIAAPWQKLAIGAERAWSVHALSDIAFTAELIDMGVYASGTTYREGNIVQDQDSSWLYINPTPSAGHAPPALPTTSNAWWKVFAGKGATGATGPAGASAYTLINVANSDVSQPGIFQATGSPGWDKKARTAEAYSAATISGMLTADAGIGLTTDPTADSSYGSVDYWFHRSTDGNIYLFRNGVQIDSTPDPDAGNTTPVGPYLIVHDGKTVRLSWKGNPIGGPSLAVWSFPVNAAGEVVYGVFNGASSGARIEQIGFSAAGLAGTSAISALLTNESHQLPADPAGNITSYAGATGFFKIFSGSQDVTSSFTLSVAANPQSLTWSGGAPGPVAVTGQYLVDGGFDAAEPNATVTYRGTGTGIYTGIVVDRVFTLAKSKAGADGTSPKLIYVSTSTQQVRLDSAGVVQADTITFKATRQNPAGGLTQWRYLDADGTPRTAYDFTVGFAATLGGTYIDSDTWSITASALAAHMAYSSSPGAIFEAYLHNDGTIIDRISIVKTQDGATGAPGVSAKSLTLSPASIAATATYTGTTTSPLPRYVTVTTMDGSTPTAPALTVTSSDSTNIPVSESGGVITITAIDIDNGFVDVSASGYPPAKLTIARTRAGASGTDQANTYKDLQILAATGSGSESFAGYPTTDTMLLTAAGGQLVLGGTGEYVADTPPSGVRRVSVKAMVYYRVAGSGSGWSTFSGPHTGGTAESQANQDAIASNISIGGTKSGLTNGTLYEVGAEFRRNSTTGSTAANGSCPTILSQT